MGYNIKQNADGSTSLVNEADSVETFKLEADGDVVVTKSSDSTAGATSIQPFQMISTMTGAGGVGGRGYFKLNADAALGSWSNALKGEVVYGASGSTSGLGSAILAEMVLSAGTDSGTYAPLELEYGFPSGSALGTAHAFINATAYGNSTEVNAFDDVGYLVDIQGLTIGDGNLVDSTGSIELAEITHGIRIRVGSTVLRLLAAVEAEFSDT